MYTLQVITSHSDMRAAYVFFTLVKIIHPPYLSSRGPLSQQTNKPRDADSLLNPRATLSLSKQEKIYVFLD